MEATEQGLRFVGERVDMDNRKILGLFLVLAVLALGAVTGVAQDIAAQETATPEDEFEVELNGRKTWKLSYGFGNPAGLALSGAVPGRISLDQTLSVDIVGEALSVLSLEIHYDDQQAESLQSMALYLDTERLDGVAGDFSLAGASDFTTYNKKLRGLRLDYYFGDNTLTAVASRSESVSQSQVFVGQSAAAEIAFTSFASEGSSLPASYRLHLEGLYAFPLKSLYAEEFSTVSFDLPASAGTRAVLAQYDLGYLNDTLVAGAESELKAQEFRVVEDSGQVLLLNRDPVSLLRDHVRDAIKAYNAANNLAGDAAERYPFAAGTDYELEFLGLLIPHAMILVDEDGYPLDESDRRRYYNLGHADVKEANLRVEVSTDGRSFEIVGSPRLTGYTTELLAADGILICDFPSEFFVPSSVIRVEFSYEMSGGAFALGLSLVPDSERVLLNNELLVRDVDYLIEYDVGMLFLLIDIEDTDVLQVDYELFSGGFGQVADYASYFFGLILDMPISDQLSIQAQLLQLAEDPFSAADAETVSTMPNRHTVAGITADISIPGFTADILLGYNQDRFPFDDNARTQKPNQVTAIAASDELVVFGHLAGITVNQFGEWASYGTANGLASRIVHDVILSEELVFIATAGGLSVVELEGASPFDRLANWTRIGSEDGLGNESATALALDDETLWIGTMTGLVSVPVDAIDDPELFQQFSGVGFESLTEITALEIDGDRIVVGTTHGAYLVDPASDEAVALEDTEGIEVTDLARSVDTVYVATARGLRGYLDGIGTGWLVLGERVESVEIDDGTLVYGIEEGLRDAGTGEMLLLSGPVTALATDGFGIWAGGVAQGTLEFDVYYIDEVLNAFPSSITHLQVSDPGGFLDADPAEHTAQGWVGRASFRTSSGRYDLSGTVESYPPTFRTIGSSSRSDRSGWSLAGSYDISQSAEMSAAHSYRVSNLADGDSRTSITNQVALRWTAGLNGVLEVRHEAQSLGASYQNEEEGELAYSLSLNDQFFDDALKLSLSWNDSTSHSSLWDDDIVRNRLSLTSTVRLTDDLSLQAGWRRPIRNVGDQLSGSERVDWSVDWARSFDAFSLSADYASDWSKDLEDSEGDWEHEASLNVDLEKIAFENWSLTPDADFSWESARGAHDVDGEVGLRVDIGDLLIRSSLEAALRDLGRPVIYQEGEISFNVRYDGVESLYVTGNYSGSVDTAIKGQSRRTTIGHTLSGRAVWEPESGARDELTLSVRTKATDGDLSTFTVVLENEYRTALDALLGQVLTPEAEEPTPETDGERETREETDNTPGYPLADLLVDSKAEYRLQSSGADVSFATTGYLNVQLSPMWSLNLGATGTVGYRPSTKLYASGLIEIEVAIDF